MEQGQLVNIVVKDFVTSFNNLNHNLLLHEYTITKSPKVQFQQMDQRPTWGQVAGCCGG